MSLLTFVIPLSLFSFISSAFILVRILLPILPPNPLGRKVPPSEFGLPNYRSLSLANKCHLWLISLDFFSLCFFLWQSVTTSSLTSANVVHEPLSAARLWIALTTRQTCLLFMTSLALLYVRLGRSVTFGPKHVLLWLPVLTFVATGTGVGVVLAEVGLVTLWTGIITYSIVIGVLTSVFLGGLVGTLLLIRRNVSKAAQDEDEKDWPPAKKGRLRHDIAINDIEALKEGASWVTSHRSSSSSHRNSISAFSFSTSHHSYTAAPTTGSAPSLLPKSSYWFGTATPNSATSIPPVPPLPSPYRDRSITPPPHQIYDDLPDDPFHRSPPRPSKSSANSWLTSPSVSQATLTEFSFPTTHIGSLHESSKLDLHVSTLEEKRPPSPAEVVKPLSDSLVLGGYGRQNQSLGLSPKASKEVDISAFCCASWFASIWLPLGLSLPYLLMASPTHDLNASFASVLLTLSVTLSSPLLAINLLLRSPLPIPTALFSPLYSPSNTLNNTPPMTEIRIHPEMRGRSTSMTVVEGRRSGDVWIANGEAVDGRSKAARVLGLLVPSPRLAVLPPSHDEHIEAELEPPVTIKDESSASMIQSSLDVNSLEMGAARGRKDSKASSYWSTADESLAYNSRIMIAQRHYSAMATTVFIQPSPPKPNSAVGASAHTSSASVGDALDKAVFATGARHSMTAGHARSRSASSIQTPRSSTQNRFPLTPPPSTPLPPTPPNVRYLRHTRSKSSSNSGYSFKPIGNKNQIDSLSAGVLPLLVPGLKIGKDVVIRDSSSPPRLRHRESKRVTPPKDSELGFSSSMSFNSPVIHSTPARTRKVSSRRWKHLSLPSLGLGKEGTHSLAAWKEELVRALDDFESKTPHNRRTIHGGELQIPTVVVHETSSGALNPVTEEGSIQFGHAISSDDPRPASGYTFGVTPPTSASVYSDGFGTARSSTVVEPTPPTSATSLLPPTFHDQQDRLTVTDTRYSSQTETKHMTPAYHLPIPPARKSSLIYIKSENTTAQNENQVQFQKPLPDPTNASAKQSIPNKSKLSVVPAGSPLRKLTLLKNRDLNTESGTRPLDISKKASKGNKENKGLRPLRLARSATAKARGLLRQDEVLPDVVVRPPSESTHTGFGYTFR